MADSQILPLTFVRDVHREETTLPAQFCFRAIHSSDLPAVRALHGLCFPVKYGEKFFSNLLKSDWNVPSADVIDSGTESVIALVVEDSSNDCIAGIITANVNNESNCSDSVLNFSCSFGERKVWYILTLGVLPEYRRRGLASALVRRLIMKVQQLEDTGVLYLHVLASNDEAVRFYEAHGFIRLSKLEGYYHLDLTNTDAYIYAFYFHNNGPPFRLRDAINVCQRVACGVSTLGSWVCWLFAGRAVDPLPIPDYGG